MLTNVSSDLYNLDAFARKRVSNPESLFDSKQLWDNSPNFWDELLETGAGITSAHSVATASTVFTSTLNTAGKFTRQTFMRFNYQPGKSQLIYVTGVLNRSGGGTGVQRRIGYFDDDNGLFFEDNEGTYNVVRRTKTSGSVVDNKVAQASWNLDALDGTGQSGVTIDFAKAQIFIIDFEWLSVGQVRFGFVMDGGVIYCHALSSLNIYTVAYMSTPNLPVRYQMITTSGSPASTMECICSTVISEGGSIDLGTLRYKSTAGVHLDANAADTLYALIGVRLKSTALGVTVKTVAASVISETNDDFEWVVLMNPTVAGAFVYVDETNSAIQTVLGVTANTVTGGVGITGGFVKANATIPREQIDNARRLGAKIDGTRDELVLCVRPLSSNANIQGSVTWRELV